MLIETGYNRDAAVAYAQKWAFGRNPRYLDFEDLGGDCTNYASQCIYAGCGVMNYTPVYGWFYDSASRRTASWTGVEFLYKFLVGNRDVGPYATQTTLDQLEPGDLVQLGDAGGHFYHSPVVVSVAYGEIYVAAHTFDAWMRPLSSYQFARSRPLHIMGARKYG
ncbi:amidase domain-containing protein [Feifania hominis]|uniref:Amidase domain-containing protein n=1 Tax=Feifania hominis TaxID=2763660 RepID=A0A926HU32_9FIRM|nr:amidase domain-containing protein [Feifania hominis]MBC8535893.1 amidase domain-containing protein [Feifania hominis]